MLRRECLDAKVLELGPHRLAGMELQGDDPFLQSQLGIVGEVQYERAVQEMLGHESILTTEIYTHLDRDYLRSTIHQFHPRS